MQLGRVASAVLDFCYPAACACCQTPVGEGLPLCEGCRGELGELERGAACLKCAMPLAQWGDPCPYCLGKGVRPYQSIVRLGRFEGPLREMIHLMKYRHRWTLAEELADRLLEQRHVRELLERVDVLVPVPLHWWRQIRRGYNQADVIARRLARRTGLPLAHPAVRWRRTETQTAIHARAGREQNLRGAFRLRRPKSIHGKRVCVIDDVMTTSATLRSLGRVLRQAQPASLSAIVLAVADPRGRGFTAI